MAIIAITQKSAVAGAIPVAKSSCEEKIIHGPSIWFTRSDPNESKHNNGRSSGGDDNKVEKLLRQLRVFVFLQTPLSKKKVKCRSSRQKAHDH